MGAFQGNLTYKTFFVQGELPEDWKTLYLNNIRKLEFKPLTPDAEAEEVVGWVSIERPLQTDFHLNNVVFNSFINLGFRKDRWTIPSDLLKAHLEEAEGEYKIQNEKKHLSRFERDDLKKRVKKLLKERSIPKMKVIDMSWDIERKRVRFWSQSGTVCELFEEFFEETFDLTLQPASPYIHGLQFELSEDELESLATVEPSNFMAGVPTIEY
jgi:recombination associated protein RdgC